MKTFCKIFVAFLTLPFIIIGFLLAAVGIGMYSGIMAFVEGVNWMTEDDRETKVLKK